ncbi:MAG: hypothetical protein ACOX7F_04960 [Eubacteriales bacterium]|jgi:tetratricopeptide (TPR) repeat protein
MGFFDFFKGKNSPDDPETPEEMDMPQEEASNAPQAPKDASKEPMLPFVDPYGRPVSVPLSQWKTEVLPKLLEKHREQPIPLYNDILLALQHNVAQEVLEPAQHLSQLDPCERTNTLLAIAQLKCGDAAASQATLESYIAEHGKTGPLLTNLAKAQYTQKDTQGALATLWEGLTLDPNQSNGLPWYAALHMQSQGKEGYLDALRRASQLKDSWLPQLYLARDFVQNKELEPAMELYRKVLSEHPTEPAVFMISSDLGMTGHPKELVELLDPIFDLKKYSVRVAINLLNGYLQAGHPAKAQALLNILLRLERPELKNYLLAVSSALDKARPAPKLTEEERKEIKLEMVSLDKPMWYYGLNNPQWLLPAKQEDAKLVAVLSYADITQAAPEQNVAATEDESSRLTRSIPLLMGSRMAFLSQFQCKNIIPCAHGIGPVLSRKEADETYLRNIASKIGADYLITGTVLNVDSSFGVTTIFYDREKDSFQRAMKLLPKKNLGPALLDLVEEITDLLHIEEAAVPGYTPSAVAAGGFATALTQSLSQLLIQNGQVPLKLLRGERNILNWMLNLALADPSNTALKLLFIGGLSKSRSYGSNVYLEFHKQVLQMVQAEPEDSPVRRLLPLIYRLYNHKEPLEKLQEQTTGDDEYSRWVHSFQ